MDIEILAKAVHEAYCEQRIKDGKEPYWTGGDYNKLDEATKEYDRTTVRAVIKASKDTQLGCATTRELIKELARRDLAGLDLNYRPIDS